MQRVGRTKYAQYRIIVQEAQLSPKSGRVVANLGHYNPHTKDVTLNKEQVAQYLENGAQPSDSVIRILKAEKVTLPKWVQADSTKVKRAIKNPEKLRKNQPKEAEPESEDTAEPAANEDSEKAEPETSSEENKETPTEETEK